MNFLSLIIFFVSIYIFFRLKICDDAIVSLAFSPDGKKLAFGAKDDSIYYFEDAAKNLPDNKSHKILKGHSSHVKHLDFANDNVHIRSNSADHELLYWNGEEQVTNTETIDEIGSDWSTQNKNTSYWSAYAKKVSDWSDYA